MDPGPMRTCAGCRGKRSRHRLIRVARAGDASLAVDPTGSAPGRGAYVCYDEACIERALRSGSLAKALRLRGPLPTGLQEDLLRMTKGIDG